MKDTNEKYWYFMPRGLLKDIIPSNTTILEFREGKDQYNHYGLFVCLNKLIKTNAFIKELVPNDYNNDYSLAIKGWLEQNKFEGFINYIDVEEDKMVAVMTAVTEKQSGYYTFLVKYLGYTLIEENKYDELDDGRFSVKQIYIRKKEI